MTAKWISPESEVVEDSDKMKAIMHQVRQVADKNVIVLITGDTGVGKDLIAQKIHELSPRKLEIFRSINCSTFYGDTLYSEIFGHVKGAFTGATKDRRGLFEQANGGTLFLNEVGTMPSKAQAELLDVIETQSFTKLGDEKKTQVNVRIIAATNAKLANAIRSEQFREDLYYRLRSIVIHIPPLRSRREDIPGLTEKFIKELNHTYRKTVTSTTKEVKEYLQNAKWYGNVRELKSALQTAIVFSTTEELQLKDFPPEDKDESAELVEELIELIEKSPAPEERRSTITQFINTLNDIEQRGNEEDWKKLGDVLESFRKDITEPQSNTEEKEETSQDSQQTQIDANNNQISLPPKGIKAVEELLQAHKIKLSTKPKTAERAFYTLVALIENRVIIDNLESNMPYYNEIQLVSRGWLQRHYQKVIKPILKANTAILNTNTNIALRKIRKQFQKVVVTQLSVLTELYKAEQSINNEDANQFPPHLPT